MNVFILSDHDFQGGAAIAACRIEASIDRANQHYHQGDGLHDDTQRVVFFSDGKVTPLAELWYDDMDSLRRAAASAEMKRLTDDGALIISQIKTFVIDEKQIIPPPPAG